MPEQPSILSLMAAGLYLLVAGCAASAWHAARSNRQHAWHETVWALIATLFLALAASRFLGFEDIVRQGLRNWLRATDGAAGRRVWQSYLIAAVVAAASALGFYGIYAMRRRFVGRRNIAAGLAIVGGGAMLALVGLRLISLHAMDALLFGPAKLNWFIDIGATVLVLGTAIFYRLRAAGPTGRNRRNRSRAR
ncbi:MAG: hypothetical protein V2I43_00780 [Parvularcula sp.]|nr:hypothetical protein [Parvularcula sp.]